MYFVAPTRPAAASCIKPLSSCIYSLVNQWKATLRNDVRFPRVYRRIYSRKFMRLSNQTLRCICKCIRMVIVLLLTIVNYVRYTCVISLVHHIPALWVTSNRYFHATDPCYYVSILKAVFQQWLQWNSVYGDWCTCTINK